MCVCVCAVRCGRRWRILCVRNEPTWPTAGTTTTTHVPPIMHVFETAAAVHAHFYAIARPAFTHTTLSAHKLKKVCIYTCIGCRRQIRTIDRGVIKLHAYQIFIEMILFVRSYFSFFSRFGETRSQPKSVTVFERGGDQSSPHVHGNAYVWHEENVHHIELSELRSHLFCLLSGK